MISFLNLAEPVTLVRSPTLTKGMSLVSVKGSRPESMHQRPVLGTAARRMPADRFGDGADMLRRRAAAAADDIDQAFARELLDLGRHEVGALVILAERVGQAGIRIGADEGIGDSRTAPPDAGAWRRHPARS